MIQPQWSVSTLLAWAQSETRCTCTNCMPADVVRAKQVIIDMFGGRDDLGSERGAEVFQSEDLGYLVLVIGRSLHRLDPELAIDIGAALFTHAQRAASEFQMNPMARLTIQPSDQNRVIAISDYVKAKVKCCGEIADDGRRLCLMEPGHTDPHWGDNL